MENLENKSPNEIEKKIFNSEKDSNLNKKEENININQTSPKKKLSLEDFEIQFVLGKGSYAKVVLAKNKNTEKFFALKIIEKKFLKREKKENEALIERNMLLMIDHPNVITLHSTFQDVKKLYFILDYCPNRDLSDFVKTQGILQFDLAQFYTAEIVSALENIHNKGIYHRDLKPENIILDEEKHLKIVDFATASMKDKIFDKIKKNFVEKPQNFKEDLQNDNIDYDRYLIETGLIGTPEYLSPESLIEGNSSPAVDLWALGCIVYLFFHGSTPFKEKTNKLIFNRIENIEYFCDEDLDEDIKDLIKKLLVRNPLERLGNGSKELNLDYESLKSHNFFKGINWENLDKINPPVPTKKKLMKYKIKNNSTDNLLLGSICKSQRKSTLNKIISESDLIDNFTKDEMKDLYGKEKYENFINKGEFTKDISEELETIVKKNEIRKSIKNQELLKDEVLYEDIVQKKSPWFHYNKRILKLYKSSKLDYIHPDTLLVRGTINLEKNCKGVFIDKKKFDLLTNTESDIWVEKINNMINEIE